LAPPPTAPRLPRHDDGLRAVAWLPRSWRGPFVSEGIFHLQLMRAGRALRRARLRPINPMGGERAVFTFAFSTRRSCFSRSSPRAALAVAPLLSELFLLLVLRLFARSHGAPAASHHHRPVGVGALDGDTAGPEPAGSRWPASGERGQTAGRLDRAIGKGASAQPSARLRGQLRPLP
jgi:hypothetical protein